MCPYHNCRDKKCQKIHPNASPLTECKFSEECERILCTLKHPKVFIYYLFIYYINSFGNVKHVIVEIHTDYQRVEHVEIEYIININMYLFIIETSYISNTCKMSLWCKM